jgi:hypothetical protein
MSSRQSISPDRPLLDLVQTALARPLALEALVAVSLVVPLVLYLIAAGSGFLYDDARMVLINAGPLARLAEAFFEAREGFYRPVFDLVIGLEGNLFWDSAFPYHVVNVAIHGLCSWLVFQITNRWYGRWPGIGAALLFWGGVTHVEAVAWISGLTSVLGALGCLAAVSALQVAERSEPQRRANAWYAIALLSWVMGLLAKENAYTLPVAVVVLWSLQDRRDVVAVARKLARFVVPATIIMVSYAPVRVTQGIAYTNVSLTPFVLAKNAVYYAISMLLPLPDDFRHFSDLTSWQASPLLGAVLLVSFIPALLWVWSARHWLDFRRALGWIAWSSIVALPALPIVAEREYYLPSAGLYVALAAAISPLVARRQMGVRPSKYLQLIGAVATACLFLSNWAGLAERAYWWNEAGDEARRVVQQVLNNAKLDVPNVRLALFNVPDGVRFAHIQGAHLCWTISFASGGRTSPTDCYLRVAPDDGFYSEEKARREMPAQIASGNLAPPIRLIVFDGTRVTLSARIDHS